MRRRAVLAGIASVLAPAPLAAQAQQRDRMRRLGVVIETDANDPVGQAWAAALRQGLGALDWHEGGNLLIDWRWGGSDPALAERQVAELVARGPEVIVANGSVTIEVLRRRTRTIPIVFALVADPVGQGFVESLAHPGGNITGFSGYDLPMGGKWLQMLTQISPSVARVALLYNPVTNLNAAQRVSAIKAAAASLAVSARAAPVKDDPAIEAMMAELGSEERGGLLVLPDIFNIVHRDAILAAAARHRVPAVYPYHYFVTAGGLMSYGIDQSDLFRRSAAYVDRILKGANPSDLPVQAPIKFETAFNLKTAAALGVTISPSLLLLADEVIE